MKLWPRCWREGGSPELRDSSGSTPTCTAARTGRTSNDVAGFLRTVDPPLGPGELNCWHDSTHPLYLMLDLEPATRYMHYGTAFGDPQARRERIAEEVRGQPAAVRRERPAADDVGQGRRLRTGGRRRPADAAGVVPGVAARRSSRGTSRSCSAPGGISSTRSTRNPARRDRIPDWEGSANSTSSVLASEPRVAVVWYASTCPNPLHIRGTVRPRSAGSSRPRSSRRRAAASCGCRCGAT